MISIIIPVYNTEKYLSKCLESVLSQTYQNFEILLIDDGSTDDSFLICQKYSKIDNRIKLFQKLNSGQGAARNLGLKAFQGAYVCFIDSDDWVAPNLLQVLLDNARKTNADISCCTVYSNESGVDKKTESELIVKSNQEAMSAFVRNQGPINHSPVCKLFSNNVIKNMQFIEISGYEDAGTIFKAFINAKSVVSQNISLYFYLQHEESTMHRKFSKKDFDRITAYKEMERGLLEYEKYKNSAEIITKAKIGAIYYVVGESVRINYSDRKELIKKCVIEAKTVLKENKRISIKNKLLLCCLYKNPNLFGFLYKIKHK